MPRPKQGGTGGSTKKRGRAKRRPTSPTTIQRPRSPARPSNPALNPRNAPRKAK